MCSLLIDSGLRIYSTRIPYFFRSRVPHFISLPLRLIVYSIYIYFSVLFQHSCEPNMFLQNVFIDTHDLRFPRLALFTSQPVAAGTEMRWDYNYIVDSVPNRQIKCECGAKLCRGRLLQSNELIHTEKKNRTRKSPENEVTELCCCVLPSRCGRCDMCCVDCGYITSFTDNAHWCIMAHHPLVSFAPQLLHCFQNIIVPFFSLAVHQIQILDHSKESRPREAKKRPT